MTVSETQRFGDRENLAIDVVCTRASSCAGVLFTFWIGGRKFVAQSPIEIFEAHCDFDSMRERFSTDEDCELLRMAPIDILEKYSRLIQSSDPQNLDDLDALLKHSLWFSRAFGDACILAVRCNERFHVMAKTLDVPDISTVAVSVDLLVSILENVGNLLELIWRQECGSGIQREGGR